MRARGTASPSAQTPELCVRAAPVRCMRAQMCVREHARMRAARAFQCARPHARHLRGGRGRASGPDNVGGRHKSHAPRTRRSRARRTRHARGPAIRGGGHAHTRAAPTGRDEERGEQDAHHLYFCCFFSELALVVAFEKTVFTGPEKFENTVRLKFENTVAHVRVLCIPNMKSRHVAPLLFSCSIHMAIVLHYIVNKERERPCPWKFPFFAWGIR